MIIAGYPCIGKSTVAARNPKFIDLESSNFSQTGLHNWSDTYANVAKDLSRTHNVFVSTHPDVIEQLLDFPYFILVFPHHKLKNQWIERAHNRYNNEIGAEDKNNRAFIRIRDHFDEDITALERYHCNRFIIPDMLMSIDEVIK